MMRVVRLSILFGLFLFLWSLSLDAASSAYLGAAEGHALHASHKARDAKGFQLDSQDGVISPVNPNQCCNGMLTADFTGTPPIGQSTLTLNISASSVADTFTNCNAISGTGTLTGLGQQFTVELFNGELCGGTAHPVRYTLTGTLGIYKGTGECPGISGQPQTAVVGTLVAYGAVQLPGNSTNPIPGSESSLVNIIGLSGAIPLCTP
jgi:hypothetical protein